MKSPEISRARIRNATAHYEKRGEVNQHRPLWQEQILPDRTLEVYSAPLAPEGCYRERTDFRAGEVVCLDLAPGHNLQIAVADVLPKR